MKKILISFLFIIGLLQAKDIKLDIFLGQDMVGSIKVDRTQIDEKYSDYRGSLKVELSYDLYKHMNLIAGMAYQTYYIDSYKGSYTIFPYFLGIRYASKDEKEKSKYNPYITLSYGANILEGEEEFQINKETNGYAEMDFGLLYKNTYFIELAYKHNAFTYIPTKENNGEYWNGQMVGINLGYRLMGK